MKTESELLDAISKASKEYYEYLTKKDAETIPYEIGCRIAFQLGGLMALIDKATRKPILPAEKKNELLEPK